MVCLGDIRVITLYKGDKDDDNNNNNNNNKRFNCDNPVSYEKRGHRYEH